MRIFEFHFNPKAKEEVAYDSFCYEPENIYEKKLGNLYIVGELTNLLPQNVKLLDILPSIIKREYYAKLQGPSEQNLRESLKGANQFLEDLTKKGNVNWLGNLNFAVLSINPLLPGKDFILNFTKIGNLKILLLRGTDILDIGQNLEFQEVAPHPSRVFGNIVTGKLTEGDKIIVLTEEVFKFFFKENLIEAFSKLETIEQKKLKEILKPKEKDLETLFGMCFLVVLTPEIPLVKEHPQALTFKTPRLPPITIFTSLLTPFKSIGKVCRNQTRNFSTFISEKIKALPRRAKQAFLKKLPRPKIIPKVVEGGGQRKIGISKKNLISIVILALFLVGSFYIFKEDREKPYREAQQVFEETQAKITQAENALIFKDEERANYLFQEAWNKILPLTKTGAPLKEEALILKGSIEKSLAPLNKLETVEEPELVFEFGREKTELIPQRILGLAKDLYFFNPFSANLYKLEPKEGVGNTLKANRNLKLGVFYLDSILFFSEPNLLISLKNGEFQEKSFEIPSPNSSFTDLAAFQSNVYFLDAKSGEIVKYLAPLTKEPQFWLLPKTKKAIGAKSMATDGSVWVLTHEGKINRYFAGTYKENLTLNLFPYLKNPTKIWTSANHSYLYLLEPAKKRVVILTKHGEIVKQYQSEKFNNLLDFAVSQDAKTIYLLNGLKVYQINF